MTVITNLSLAHFLPEREGIGLHGAEIGRVFAAVLVPIATGMEIGFHNAAVALTLAMSLTDDSTLAVPAGTYRPAVMVAAGFGFLLDRVLAPRADSAPSTAN